jgi:hypothetical protein
MPNMSYCRFQNTAMDLDDCQESLEALINGDEERPLSREELAAAKRLVSTCLSIVSLVADSGDCEVSDLLDDERRADAILDRMQEAAR